MKHLKKLLIVALVVVLTIGLTSAWFGKKKTSDSPIKLLWWGSQSRHDKTLKVVDMFQAKYPDIKVEATFTSWGSYWEKLSTLSAGGDMPDVFQMTIQNLPMYQQKGLLADIGKIKTVDIAAIDKSLVDIGKIDGKLYGICLGSNAYTLVYNKSLFDKAGIDAPNENWTWDDIAKNSKILQDKLGVWGIGNMSEVSYEFYLRTKGETLYADNEKEIGFTEKTALEYFQLVDTLHKSGAMEPRKIAIETKSNEENSPYAKEKCAMRFLWSNKVVGVVKTLGKISDLTVFPGPGAKEGVYVKPSMFFSVAESSKRKDDAGTFVNFFVSDIEANKVLDADRGVPALASVRKALAPTLDEQNQKIWDYVAFVADYSTKGIDKQFPKADKECKRALNDILEQVYYEKMTPDVAAKELIASWDNILTK